MAGDAGGGSGLFRPKIVSDGERADNTADFIYGSRLLLSCDLTAAARAAHGGTRQYRGGNARKKRDEKEKERETRKRETRVERVLQV